MVGFDGSLGPTGGLGDRFCYGPQVKYRDNVT